jgi:CheY-like chemotaxis protein
MLSQEKPKILVADDERTIADTLSVILNQNGFEALAVYGGRQAVQQAARWTPDVFLSDVSMPEVDGIHAAMEICTMLPECRIVLFSGEPRSRRSVQSMLFLGYRFEFLHKPIPPADLLHRLRRLCAA